MTDGVLVVQQPVARLVIGENADRVLVVEQPVARLVAVAEQGVSGPAGPSFSGFGDARYTALAASPVVLEPGVRTMLTMSVDPDPAQTFSVLKGQFAGVVFWDGSTFRTPLVNDTLLIRIGLTAVTEAVGGSLDLEAMIIGGAVLSNATTALVAQATQPQRVTLLLELFAGTAFLTSGVQFYLTSTVPVAITNETVVVTPLSSGAPAEQGSSGGVENYFEALIGADPQYDLVLATPAAGPGMLTINGLIQPRSSYAIAGTALTLDAALDLQPDDFITLTYP